MKVVVKTLDDMQISFEVEPSDTPDSLKEKIYRATGIPLDYQKLIFYGRPSWMYKTFADTPIQDGGYIHWPYSMLDFSEWSIFDTGEH